MQHAFSEELEGYLFPNFKLTELVVGSTSDLNLRERTTVSSLPLISSLQRSIPSVRGQKVWDAKATSQSPLVKRTRGGILFRYLR